MQTWVKHHLIHITVDEMVFQLIVVARYENDDPVQAAHCAVEAVQMASRYYLLDTIHTDHIWTEESVIAVVKAAKMAWSALQFEMDNCLSEVVKTLCTVSMFTRIKAIDYDMVDWDIPAGCVLHLYV